MAIELYFMAAGKLESPGFFPLKTEENIDEGIEELRERLGRSAVLMASSQYGSKRTAKKIMQELDIDGHSRSVGLNYYGRNPQDIYPLSFRQFMGIEIGLAGIDPGDLAGKGLIVVTHSRLMAAASGNPKAHFRGGSILKYEGQWNPPPPPVIVPIEL